MPLQIDATTRYATGNYTKPLTDSQLNSPSPYNTRNHKGLPPDADRQSRARVDPGRGPPGPHELPVLRRQAVRQRRAACSSPATRSSWPIAQRYQSARTSRGGARPRTASRPSTSGRRLLGWLRLTERTRLGVLGWPVGAQPLAGDAQRRAGRGRARQTGATSCCRSRPSCSRRPSGAAAGRASAAPT